jgi:hypothetical protein
MAFFRKYYIVPGEHGAWVWLLGPLAIGAAAGGKFSRDFFLLLVASLAIFMFRHPATLAVKALSGRRNRADLIPSVFWAAVYGLVALAAFAVLALRGYAQLLLLAIPGIPVFSWHLYLVSRRSERDQPGVEIAATGVLALGATAAYWVCGGDNPLEGVLLWSLSWLYAAASIVYVHLRLQQRQWENKPAATECLRRGTHTLLFQGFNWIISLALVLEGFVPTLVSGAFLFSALEALHGVVQPAVNAKPASIGYRQLFSSIIFVIIIVAAYWV